MNEPWFGYAHYDIYTQTMTIHLRKMDETYIALVDEYIAENDKGGCTFVYDTTDVSYASVHRLIETMRRNYGLFCSLGIEFFVFIDGDLCIKISKPYLEWISIPLIEFLADKHTKLLFFYD
ncbi:MAG: hypothetical protein E7604_12525 [Ruminococcaceae bacterium]|nr:hypothetical protein [Oscillospiraceae bacterium]